MSSKSAVIAAMSCDDGGQCLLSETESSVTLGSPDDASEACVEIPEISLLPEDGDMSSAAGGLSPAADEQAASLLAEDGPPLSRMEQEWKPGQNVGRFIGRGAPLGAQAQILLVNVVSLVWFHVSTIQRGSCFQV